MLDWGAKASFPTTRWSRIRAAGANETDALDEMCRAYYYPLYAFGRRSGCDVEKAKDLTQGFFARLVEKNDLAGADRKQGTRFRSWLLACVKHFMANEWDREIAAKRGGGLEPLSLDAMQAEGLYVREPSYQMEPERLFDLRWANAVVERTLAALGAMSEDDASRAFLERVKPLLTREVEAGEYGPLALELGLSPGALRTRVSRLRDRFRAQIRKEVAETLEDPNEVDDELRYLIEILGAAWAK